MNVNELLLGMGMRRTDANDTRLMIKPTAGAQPAWLGEVFLNDKNRDAGGALWIPAAEPFKIYCAVNEAGTSCVSVYELSFDRAKLHLLHMYPQLELM